MSEVTNKNYHESTPFQRAGDSTLKFLAVAFLVATVLTCVITSIKAHSLNGGPDTWEKSGWRYERVSHPNGPHFGSYVATAVCTAVGVIPAYFFIGYAFFAKRYPKKLSVSEIEELRQPIFNGQTSGPKSEESGFNRKRALLFWNNGSWSKKRVASLEQAVREGRLTKEDVEHFDGNFLKLHLKKLEIESHERSSGVKIVTELNSHASPKLKQDHQKLQSLRDEFKKLRKQCKAYESSFHTGQELG